MQSTGHTSTQERSFTLMHGSAMMYGIQALVTGRIANIDWGPSQSSPACAATCWCAERAQPTPPALVGTEISVISDRIATSPAYWSQAVLSGCSAASPNHAAS